MSQSENAFDRAIASSIEAIPTPDFPATRIRSRITDRIPEPRYSLNRRVAAAIAIFACSAGLAYGTPKVLHAMRFTVGNANYELITPGMRNVSERDMYAESSFHVRLPARWPKNLQRQTIWRLGPAAARSYVLQYAADGGNSGANAVVFVEKAGAEDRTHGGLFMRRKRSGLLQTSWTTGDERITIVSHDLSPQQLQDVRISTP